MAVADSAGDRHEGGTGPVLPPLTPYLETGNAFRMNKSRVRLLKGKLPKCPSVDEWINKLRCMYTTEHYGKHLYSSHMSFPIQWSIHFSKLTLEAGVIGAQFCQKRDGSLLKPGDAPAASAETVAVLCASLTFGFRSGGWWLCCVVVGILGNQWEPVLWRESSVHAAVTRLESQCFPRNPLGWNCVTDHTDGKVPGTAAAGKAGSRSHRQ